VLKKHCGDKNLKISNFENKNHKKLKIADSFTNKFCDE
jgi:hypothetical protein